MAIPISYITENEGMSTAHISPGAPLSSEDSSQFMQLLLVQLRNQNPLEPMDNSDLLGQMTQLNSLEQLRSINQALGRLAGRGQLLEAATLIGKLVHAVIGDGPEVTGTVTGISQFEDQVMLWLGEQEVPLESVIRVSEVEA